MEGRFIPAINLPILNWVLSDLDQLIAKCRRYYDTVI